MEISEETKKIEKVLDEKIIKLIDDVNSIWNQSGYNYQLNKTFSKSSFEKSELIKVRDYWGGENSFDNIRLDVGCNGIHVNAYHGDYYYATKGINKKDNFLTFYNSGHDSISTNDIDFKFFLVANEENILNKTTELVDEYLQKQQSAAEKRKQETKVFEEHSKSLAKELGIEPESPSKFDIELTDYINGKLSKNHIFDLGTPSEILQKCGFPKDQRIELSASHLDFKAKLQRHPFELSEIKGLDRVLKNPIAVFEYGDRTKSQNVIVNIQKDGKNFLTGIHFNQQKNGFEISSVRTLYPKDNIEWLNWINQGKMIYGNKEKLQALIAQQRMNVADVNSQVAQSPLYEHCLESALNILQDFPAVNDIFTDGNSTYEEIKERADIEKRFYSYYTEKGNLDARVLAENEALEFYDALKNNNQEKIFEYTEHEELHEISELAKEILYKYKQVEISQQTKTEVDNQVISEPTKIEVDGKEFECKNGVVEGFKNAVRQNGELIKDYNSLVKDFNTLADENEKLRQQLQSRNHSTNSYS